MGCSSRLQGVPGRIAWMLPSCPPRRCLTDRHGVVLYPGAGPLALVRSVLLGRLLRGLAAMNRLRDEHPAPTMRHPPDTVDQRISCPDATSNQNDMSGTPSHANSGG
ncbi:Uncharacterised protein [Mycobacteroides abscessus subsp. abscessus]|nr:Uncharacterised protein [Mycobacteroides abscessus subsp. abscessus]